MGSGRASISVIEVVVVESRRPSQRDLAAPHPAHPPPIITYFLEAAGVVEEEWRCVGCRAAVVGV